MTQPLGVGAYRLPDDLLEGLRKLEDNRQHAVPLRQAWRGTRPAAYLSAESRRDLDHRLSRMGVNYVRLAVNALAQRMVLAGITDPWGDSDVWEAFCDAGGRELAEMVHVDRLLYGSAYITVWGQGGTPVLTGDTPFTMTHGEDPATGATRWALRRWTDGTDTHAALYYPDRVELYVARGVTDAAGSAFSRRDTVENMLGSVPVVPFTRRMSLSDDGRGASAVEDLVDLTDAASKVLADAMVTSEFFARPRRWATGLEIEEDEQGNPVDPFGKRRFLQSEDPETKFGQLDPARLDGAADLLASITQQIGALSGLPPHYLGLHGDQPASADGIRAAEAQLTARARTECRAVTNEWQRVAWLISAVQSDTSANLDQVGMFNPVWESPETSTPAMDADAAVKLRGIGVPLQHVLTDTLGVEPDVAARLASEARAETVLSSIPSRPARTEAPAAGGGNDGA